MAYPSGSRSWSESVADWPDSPLLLDEDRGLGFGTTLLVCGFLKVIIRFVSFLELMLDGSALSSEYS